MASKKVSPKGIGSGIRMIQFFINRAGKGTFSTTVQLVRTICIAQAHQGSSSNLQRDKGLHCTAPALTLP
jgi:hypothetical protein